MGTGNSTILPLTRKFLPMPEPALRHATLARTQNFPPSQEGSTASRPFETINPSALFRCPGVTPLKSLSHQPPPPPPPPTHHLSVE